MKRILNWFRLRRLESDLDRELQYHIDRRMTDLIHSGLPEPEARRRVPLELGGATQVREEVRDIWLTRWLRDFVYDLRFSARSFLRSPSFTATAVLSLALGIGATTALYSLIDQVVLRALPVDHPERLVLIDWNRFPKCRDLRHWQLDVLPDLPRSPAAEAILRRRILPCCDNDQLLDRRRTQADCRGTRIGYILFGTGSEPALGRLLTIDDDQVPGSSPVVVLSYDFWKNQLGGAQDIVGRKVLVNQYPMTVVGVAGAGISWHRRGREFHRSGFQPSCRPRPFPASHDAGSSYALDADPRPAEAERLFGGSQTGLQPWFKAMLDEDTRRTDFSRASAEQRRQFLASTLDTHPGSARPFCSAAAIFRGRSGSCSWRRRCSWLWLA